MKLHLYLLALAPFALAGCVVQAPPPVTTTTTVTREVTTIGPNGTETLVAQEPPAVRVESQTVSPGPNYIWTRGYWRWNGVTYVWVPGSWMVRPRPAAVYVEGHWLRRGSRWVWVAGYWR
jgi:WXXGXW repeat (2 copies)